ncbi:MAG: DUF4260 family protein, partial [Candidatus Poribacteria bacterium]|nr:DUF4260 family protein [Candidatus Poribacteria bacterium]
MRWWLKTEALGLFGLSVWMYSETPYSAWWYVGLFLTPDVSMLAYLVNKRIGAFVYNVAHHQGVAAAVTLTGIVAENSFLFVAG